MEIIEIPVRQGHIIVYGNYDCQKQTRTDPPIEWWETDHVVFETDKGLRRNITRLASSWTWLERECLERFLYNINTALT